MAKKLIKEVKPYCNLYIDDKTGISWIEDGNTGMGHSVHPNIDITGSVRGMKERGYWDKEDKIVRSHGWQYNISKFVCNDELDEIVAKHCQCEKCIERRRAGN
ncbi:MAG: hypothetical protein PHT02_01230 [Tissierellia bacterium]|nr:hypothetical protein [Tissierellia bacterium]